MKSVDESLMLAVAYWWLWSPQLDWIGFWSIVPSPPNE